MATLFKIILAFGCILFLVSNSKAGVTKTTAEFNYNTLQGDSHYNLLLHEKR